MAKIVFGILTLAAFLTAATIVLLGRPVPNLRGTQGLRRQFLLAVVFAVTILTAPGGLLPPRTAAGDHPAPSVWNQEGVGGGEAENRAARRASVVEALRAIWATLNAKRSDEFSSAAGKTARDGKIRRRVAQRLSTAFREIAYHRARTRGEARRTCYRMSRMGGAKMKSRESALKQVELLRKALEGGAIDEATAAKARAVLAREIETLHRAEALGRDDPMAEGAFFSQLKRGGFRPGDAASVAAGLIVSMEGGPDEGPTPAERLASMKKRVETLYRSGPSGNDWHHPALSYDMISVLQKAGILPTLPRPTCYTPAPGVQIVRFSPGRGEELRALQKRLLDRNVKAGILPVELAEKIRAAEARGEEPDVASEKDIAGYQKRVRRTTRLLYRQGELPSAFVRKVEQAIDLEIIVFDPALALRNDVAFHIRPALITSLGEAAEKAMAKRGLIPKPRNERFLRLHSPDRTALGDADREKLALFERLLDGDVPFDLPGDEKKRPRSWELPRSRLELRKELRRAVRALVMAGIASAGSLERAGSVIGIPVVGRME
jgi:hypothetical protein